MILFMSIRNLLLVNLLFVFVGCEMMSYNDYALPKYDGVLEWTEVTRNAEWKNRFDFDAAVFHDKIWLAGGYNPGEMKMDTYYEDVWSSTDGENWAKLKNNAPWLGRRGHQLVSFDNGDGEALYLIGGFSVNEENGYRQYNNDVWKSEDGIDWQEIKTTSFPIIDSLTQEEVDSVSIIDWYPRKDHQCVVKQVDGVNYIFLIGGFTMQDNISGRYASKYFNDVWRSSNGIEWERVANNDFGIRSEHAVTVNSVTGKIYMHGGIHGLKFETGYNQSHSLPNYQAVWSSVDGVNWSADIDTSLNTAIYWRSDHQMVFYEDKVWNLPGKTTSEVHYHFTESGQFPIWNIDLNNSISIDSEGEAFDARHGYASLVFKNKIWILGGMTNKQGQANDVWCGEMK